MKQLFFLSLILLFLAACSGPKSTVTSDVKIFSASALVKSIPEDSSVFIYGESLDGKSFSHKITTESHTIELPKGVWNIFGFINHTTSDVVRLGLRGKTECGKKVNLTLSDNQDRAEFEIVLANEFCKDSSFTRFFTSTSSADGLEVVTLPELMPFTCLDNTGFSDFPTGRRQCISPEKGGPATAFRIKYYNLTNFDSLNQSREFVLDTRCYEIDELSDLRIPINFPPRSLEIEYYFTDYNEAPCSPRNGVQAINFNINESGSINNYVYSNDKTKLGIFTKARSDLLYNPRRFSATDETRSTVTLSWLSAEGKASGYRIVTATRATTPNDCNSSSAIPLSASTKSFRVERLTPDTTYYFRICSVDDAGNMSTGVEVRKRTSPRVSITSVTSASDASPLVKDEQITIAVNFDDDVNFSDSPYLMLNLKNTYVLATYDDSASTSNRLIFVYTADYGDYHPNAADQITIGDIQGSVFDEEGNAVNLTIPAANRTFSGVAIETCPDPQSIHVPRNDSLGINYNFCVMKYEGQQELDGSGSPTGHVTSEVLGSPWVSVSPGNASSACEETTYEDSTLSLISNAEWMTIARNLEGKADSNTYESGGVTKFYRGHTDNSTASVLQTPEDEDPYFSTGNNAESGQDQRRTLTLSNGEVIWDFSGNAAEWVDMGEASLPNCSAGTFSVTNCPSYGPTGASSGILYLGKVKNSYVSGTHSYMARGGDYNDGDNAGIYSIFYSSGTATANIGFRCVLRPDLVD